MRKTYPVFPFEAISALKNSFNSFKKAFFFTSGQPFIGLDGGVIASHCGLISFVDVPGIFLPESS